MIHEFTPHHKHPWFCNICGYGSTEILMHEQWRDIFGYEGSYEVSSLGRVRSLDRQARDGRTLTGRIMRSRVRRRDGYVVVNLVSEIGTRSEKVHQLVCRAFRGPPGCGEEPDHHDGDRSNNRLSNLRWRLKPANLRNRTKPTGRSGTVGVFPGGSPALPWRVYVTVNRKKHYLGRFATITEASKARANFIRETDGV